MAGIWRTADRRRWRCWIGCATSVGRAWLAIRMRCWRCRRRWRSSRGNRRRRRRCGMRSEIGAATRAELGEERLAWLRALPKIQTRDEMALVHASPGDRWRAPGPEAGDAELEGVYGPLGEKIVVYGHVHRGFVRRLSTMTVVNSGSVSLSYDGNRRASYLLLDDGEPEIRRVEYDVEREIRVLAECGLPHSDWIARTIESGGAEM